MPNKVDQLYTALVADGIVTKGREHFDNFFFAPGEQGYKNRYDLWKALKEDGIVESPTYEDFRDRLGLGHKVASPEPKKEKTAEQPVSSTPFRVVNEERMTPVSGVPAQGNTPIDKKEADKVIGNVIGMVEDTRQNIDRTVNRVKSRQARPIFGTERVDLSLRNKNVEEVETDRINPKTFEREKEYITSDGNAYSSRAIADIAQTNIDDSKRLDELKAAVAEAKYAYENAQNGQIGNWSRGSLGYGSGSSSNVSVKDLKREYDRLSKEYADLNWRMNERNGINAGVRTQLSELDKKIGDKWQLTATQAAQYGGSVMTTNADMNYSLAHQISERTKNILAAAEANTHGRSFFGNLGAGLADAVSDSGTWDFGLSSLAQNRELKRVIQKMDKNEDLTDDEEALLQSVIVNQYVSAAYSGQLGRGYKAGQVTGESLPFMLEMIINPLSGLGDATAKKFAQGAAKYLAKKSGNRAAVKAIEGMTTKQLGRMFSGGAKWGVRGAKWGGRLLGDVVGASGMAATSGQVGVLADALQRNIGRLKYKPEVGEDGVVRLQYNGTEDGQDMWSAYEDAFLSRMFENHSEMIGEYFSPVRAAIGRVIGRGLSRSGWGREVLDFVKNASSDDMYKLVSDLRSRAKFSDGFGEFSEEIVGGIENAVAVGDQTLDTNTETGVFNLDNLIDTYLGVNVMNAVFGAVGLSGYRTNKYRTRSRMVEADDLALRAFGNRSQWEQLRNSFDNGSESDAKEILKQMVASGDYTREQIKSAMHYAGAVESYKALQQSEAGQKEQPGSAYDEGLSLTGSARNEAGRTLRAAQSRLNTQELKTYGQEIDQIIDNGGSYEDLQQYISELPAEEQEALSDYADAQLRVKGIIDNADSEIEDQVLQFEKGMAPAVQEDENGRKTITIGVVDGEQVYVGSTTGKSTIIYDATGRRPVSSQSISDMQTFDYDEYVDNYRNSIRTASADELDFVLNNHPNTKLPSVGLTLHSGEDTYQIMGVNPSTGEITATKIKVGNNGQLVPDGGSLVTLTRQDVLDMQNRYYDELDARNNGAAKEEAVGETGQTTQPVAAPSSASAVTTDLAQMEQDMTAIDPEAPQYIGMIQYSVDQFGDTDPNFYDSVPQALVEPLKAYEEAYKASKEQPAVEVDAAPTPAAESQGGSAPETEPTSDYPRDKDGDLDVTAIQNTGDAQMMADALLADFDTETANATAQQYLTDAIKAQEKEKNPVKKNGSRKKAVDYWRDVASRLNATTEQPVQTTEESPAPVQAPTLEAGSAATDKWANANKIVGSDGIYTMDDGSDIEGRYVLVEEGASTPSHDPHTFQSSEGYPVNEQGQNVNSRDYQNSPNAQASVMQMGGDYDGRALKDVPVVSADGIVWSGNNRTMSGILAAENGSDGKYIESLKKQASRFGFTPEQVEGMEHPRVVFVPNEGQGLDYTPQTFNRFNAPSQKEESSVEKGVKMGKVLSDRTFNLLSQEVSRFDGLKNVFKSENACREILRIMQESPEIVEVNQQTLPRYITPDGLLTEDGQNLLNAALVGYVFKDNADVLRYLDKLPKRAVNQLAEAMNELTTNARSGEYALTAELSEAMRALYEQQQSGLNMEEFLKQQDMFRDNSLYSQTAQALIKALDSKSGTPLKDILAQYNERAVGASNGQADMFSSNSREDILRDVLGIKQEQPQAPKEQPKQAEEVSTTNVKPRIDIATDESFKLNHTEEEQERLKYREGETYDEYCKRNGFTRGDLDKDALLYYHQKYADRWGEIETLLNDLSEDPRAIGFAIGEIVDSRHEGYDMLGLLKNIPIDSVLKFMDGVSDGYAEAKSEKNTPTSHWYGTIDEAPNPDGILKTQRETLLEEGANAMYKAALEVPAFQFGVDNPIELTFDLWAEKYREAVGDYQYGKDEPFLHEFYDYLMKRLDDATSKKRVSDRIEALKKDAELEKRDSYKAGDLVVLDEDGKVYSVDYITTEGDVIPGQQNTYTTYYHLKGKLLGKYTADQLTGIRPKSDEGTGEDGPGEPPTPPTPPASEEGKPEISEEERQAREKFSKVVTAEMVVASQTGEKPYKSIVDLRKRAREMGMKVDDSGRDDILLQELVEDGLVRAANQIIGTRMTLARLHGENPDEVRRSKELFDRIVSLYEMQPTIAARSTGRIQNQQYSTPLPMAYVAGMFAYRDGMEKGLEPTAGNGMLTIAVPAHKVHANEIDETRLVNLRGQNFAEVTDQDATLPFEGGRQYDFVIANPPFGSAEAKSYDGKLISGLDPQIALNALESMKDDGKAAIIIGGNIDYEKNGVIRGKKQFFSYLYDHYNVKGIVDMSGKLYQKQGTTYPTMMILIDGRRSDADREQTKVIIPPQEKQLPKAETFDDLFRIANEVLTSNNKTNGNEVLRANGSPVIPGIDKPSGKARGERHSGQPDATDGNGRNGGTGTPVRGGSEGGNRKDGQGSVSGTPGGSGKVSGQRTGVSNLPGEQPPVSGSGTAPDRGSSSGRGGAVADGEGSRGTSSGSTGRVQSVGNGDVPAGERGKRVEQQQEQRKLDQEKLPYRPHNSAFSLESVSPAAMVESMDASLAEIEKEVGSVDEFIRKELGYDTVEEAYDALAAEQMDSVAMAIYQMKKGQALIIGDQTGVGKGRQMAALIRWAVRQGGKPIFITKDANLFSDIYRDLADIGSGDLRPFIFNKYEGPSKNDIGEEVRSSTSGEMLDSDGNLVYRAPSESVQKKIFAGDKLPDDYDFAVLSYSQVNTGDAKSREEARQTAKKNGGRAKKKEEGKPKATPKADFLRKIARDNIMLLDESHTAAGESNTGAYLQSLVKDAKAVTFASATFAKRPDTMPLYALRTAMSKANVKPEELIAIIEKGGVTLQEIMSRALSESGQMVRRERDMSDVQTDWETVVDADTVRRARENYDKTIEAFNAIINFQDTFVKPKIEEIDGDLSDWGGTSDVKQGTDKMGVDNTPFANKAFNYTKQLLLALKVDAIVDKVDAEIKAGRHPVIALESTMESVLDGFSVGEEISSPTFALSLLRGLDTVMQYTVKDENGDKTTKVLQPSDLGPAGEKAYYDLQNFIRQSTGDIFVSPLDAIIEKLRERGYKVGELTGRNKYVGRNAEGKAVVMVRKNKDKKRMAREYNNGTLDVLILNKSASTGISLHASEKFADQRQRTMIIAQPLSDINDYMQMIGRTDRTGQVHRGYYINLGLPVPAENRFLMMLSTKLKSLNANTTTSQDSESNEVEAPDLLNKYGSQVIVEYLRDNPDIYEKMGMPLGKRSDPVTTSKLEEYKPKEEDASRVTGRVALLSTAEQDAFYDDVIKRYNDLIKYLDETGTNDLKITVMPLRAKTISKKISSEGTDPTGKNPFAGNAYVEEVEMDVLRKPMKAEEIRKTIETLNTPQGTRQGHMSTASREKMAGPRVLEIIGKIEDEAEEKRQKENARYEKAKAKAEEEIRERTEKIMASNRTDEEKQIAIENYATDKRQNVENTHESSIRRISDIEDSLKRRIGEFIPGITYMMPDDLDAQAYMFMSPAIFCGYKVKDKGVTPSTTFAVFAPLDGRRRVEVKLSDIGKISNIRNATDNNGGVASRTNLDNWDDQLPQSSRKKGYIMTGNIIQAVADTQNPEGGYPGQLISFTDDQGNVRDGILMPDKWTPQQLRTSGVPINARLADIKTGKTFTSTDGKVRIEKPYRWSTYFTLSVPKSKKEGGKYFLDPELLKHVISGEFFTKSGMMNAEIYPEEIENVVNILANMGVRVVGENEENDTELRRTSTQLNEQYPTWLSGQTTETGQHTTQITSTVKSYEHIGHWMASSGMGGAKVLDASSGLGVGTKALRDMGFDVDDVEPYPSDKREAPTYTRYEDVDGKYDVVISNAVLNVIPDDWRADVLKNMADKLKVGGKLIINVRDAKSIESQKQKIELDSPSEILVTDKNGNIRAYQKGFTKSELKQYVEEQLGEGWKVEIANENNSGLKSGTAVVVTKMPGAKDVEYRQVGDLWSIEHEGDVNSYGEQNIRTKHGLKGSSNVQYAHNADEVMQVASYLPEEDAKKLRSYYMDGTTKAYYSTALDLVIVFAEKCESADDAELAEWHEQTHGNFIHLKLPNKDELAIEILNFLATEYPDAYRHITKNYEEKDWGKEAVSYFVEETIRKYGAEKFLAGEFAGNEKVRILADEIRNSFINGYNYEETGNQRGRGNEVDGRETIRPEEVGIRGGPRDRVEYDEGGNRGVPQKTGRSSGAGETESELRSIARNRNNAPGLGNVKTGSARVNYEAAQAKESHRIKEAFQDSMQAVKDLQTAVIGETGGKLLDSQNAWMAENRLSSANKAQQDEFRAKEMRALLDAAGALGGKNSSRRAEISRYLMAKHGLERNHVFAVRDARKDYENKLEKALKSIDLVEAAMKRRLKAQLDGGVIDDVKYRAEVANAEAEAAQKRLDIEQAYNDAITTLETNPESDARYQKHRKRDYSGLTSMFDEGDVEAAEQKARDFVDDFEFDNDTQKVNDLWDAVRGVSDFALKKAYDSGLVSKQSFDEISKQFQYYVPLRGWSDTTTDEMYGYFNQHSSPISNPIQHAEGRSSEADDPIANLQNVAESAIISGNRNLVKQHFLNLARYHNTSLLSISDGWLQFDDVSGMWEMVAPKIDENDSPEVVNKKVEAFNEQMARLAESDPDHYKRQRDDISIPYIVRPGTLSEHQVFVKQGGRTYIVTVNGNPRAAQAMNGFTNPEANNDPNFKMVAAGTRLIAKMATGLNLTFMARNLVRDGLYVGPMVFIKEGPRYGAKYSANWWAGLAEMPVLVFKHKYGLLDRSKPLDKLFYDFIHNGGETGYTIADSVDECKKYIEREFRGGLDPRTWWDKLEGLFEYLGRVSEGISRFAAYRTSIEMGRSVDRAIYDAKDISVNFNKKGAGRKSVDDKQSWWVNSLAGVSQYGRSYIAFFNPAVQGLENITRATRKHPWRSAALFASLAALGASQALMNKMLVAMLGGDDDDDYYNIPDYIRKSHFCIYVGGHKYIRLAMPQEFCVPFGLAGLWQERLDNPHMPNKEFGLRFAESVSMALPVDPVRGDSYFSPGSFLPTAARPSIYDVPFNEAWTGLPIYKDYEWNKNAPEYQRVYRNTGKGYVAASKWLHEFGGGDEGRRADNETLYEWNPGKIEYLAKQHLSGTYGWFAFPIKAVERIASGEKIETKDWPVVRGFVTETDDRAKEKRISHYFYDMKKDMEKNKYHYDTYRKLQKESGSDMLKYAEYQQKANDIQNSKEYREYLIWHEGDKELKKAKKRGDTDNEKLIMQLMVEAINEFRDSEGEQEDMQSAARHMFEKYQMANPQWSVSESGETESGT